MEETRVKRKLTVILAADVEGYSRLMGADEEATLNTLGTYRDIIDGLIARHDGRIFSTAGDSVLAEFASPVEAVRTAISIQDELETHNADLPGERKLSFRIGINLGDVMIKGDDLLGKDAEGTTDASHPNDLGFFRQADAFEPVLRQALGSK